MKKTLCILIAATALIFISAFDEYAYGDGGHHHGGGHYYGTRIWIGPGWGPWWGPGWGPGWGAPYYPYSPYYYPYYTPSPGFQQEPSTYIQQAPAPEQQLYWYFCADPQGYYPYVQKCPKGWMKVVPSPGPQEREE